LLAQQAVMPGQVTLGQALLQQRLHHQLQGLVLPADQQQES
jgi:hypothetical protein